MFSRTVKWLRVMDSPVRLAGLISISPEALGWLPKLSELLAKAWHIVSA